MHAKSLKSVEDNYAVLQDLWASVLDGSVDPDVRAKACGVKSQMESFNFFFGICLRQLVLNHADNVSATLQKSFILASEGLRLVKLMLGTMEKLRNEDSFQLFWDSTVKQHASVDIASPQLYPANANTHSDIKKDQHQNSSMTRLSRFTGRFTLKLSTMNCPSSDQGLINLDFKCIVS